MASGFLGFGSGASIPTYTPSKPYTDLTFNTVYPTLQDLIHKGGLGLDTAGAERSFKENNANNYAGALDKVRAFSAPYGNPAAGNRMALRIGSDQARTESQGVRDIRTTNATQKNQSLLGILGLSAGLDDPNLKSYYANLAAANAKNQQAAQQAGILGDLAGLGLSAGLMATGVGAPLALGAGSMVPHTTLGWGGYR